MTQNCCEQCINISATTKYGLCADLSCPNCHSVEAKEEIDLQPRSWKGCVCLVPNCHCKPKCKHNSILHIKDTHWECSKCKAPIENNYPGGGGGGAAVPLHDCWEYLACNKETCDGVEFVHEFHCAECGKAKTPTPSPSGGEWEERWEEFAKKVGQLGSDRVGINPIMIPKDLAKDFLSSLLSAERARVVDEIKSRLDNSEGYYDAVLAILEDLTQTKSV